MFQEDNIPVSENYTACRMRTKYSAVTRIEYRATPDACFGSNHIEVSAVVEGFSNVWKPATINWSALGRISPESVAKFSAALSWAIDEAARIDAANVELVAAATEGAKA